MTQKVKFPISVDIENFYCMCPVETFMSVIRPFSSKNYLFFVIGSQYVRKQCILMFSRLHVNCAAGFLKYETFCIVMKAEVFLFDRFNLLVFL